MKRGQHRPTATSKPVLWAIGGDRGGVVDITTRYARSVCRVCRTVGDRAAAPNITVAYPEFFERWRFTPTGIERLLEHVFGPGELRRRATPDVPRADLGYNEPRFGLVTCARAVKGWSD